MAMEHVASFKDRLVEALGDTQYTEFAARVGVSKQTISAYCKGKRNPKRPMIITMAKELGVDPAWLLGFDVPKRAAATSGAIGLSLSVKAELIRVRDEIPLIGTIAAGQPIFAEQNIEMTLCVPTEWRVDYALRVKGQSMINAGIPSGSIVYCRKQDDVEDGQIAVCLVNGDEATLKRIKRYGNILVLHAENQEYQDLVFEGKEKSIVRIIGLAKKVTNDII